MRTVLRGWTGASAALVAASAVLSHCSPGSSVTAPPALTKAERMDPAACSGCHASHYREWAGSMHAYAANDPLFVAMNQRAQRETGGAIGNLCLRCHAPMAVATGGTTGSFDPTRLAAGERGVTCYFCHSVDAVLGASDDPLHLAEDGQFRAAIANPVPTPAHDSAYSTLHDRTVAASASLCGACHDVQLVSGLAIERTFAEWRSSAYAQPTSLMTCGKCHMSGSQGPAVDTPGASAPFRTVHDHAMPGVDLAPVQSAPSPATLASQTPAALAQALLDPALDAALCVRASGQGQTVTVSLTNELAGHGFPSGAVHNRRAWVELVASAGGQVVFESGVIPDDQTSVESLGDPNLWLLKETLRDDAGAPVLFMWEAATTRPSSLPAAVTQDPTDPRFDHAVTKTYSLPVAADEVRMRVRLAAVAPEVVASLVASGDLDPAYAGTARVYTLASTVRAWSAQDGGAPCVP